MRVRAVRGAVQVENSAESIRDGVILLLDAIVKRNEIHEGDIVSVVFSQTKDLTAANPATALRSAGYAGVPLFCTQEPDYAGSVPGILRVLITFGTERATVEPVYLNGAERLRSDLFRS